MTSNLDQEKQRIVEEFNKEFCYVPGVMASETQFMSMPSGNAQRLRDFIHESLDALHAAVVRDIRDGVEKIKVRPEEKELEGLADIFRDIWEAKFKPAVLALLSAPNKDKEE